MKTYIPLDGSPNKSISEVAEYIKTLYPIGTDPASSEYDLHPKIFFIANMIEAQMNGYNKFIKPWNTFLLSLKKITKSKIVNAGFAHETAYTGKVMLEKFEDESLIRIKKIIFSVSLLAPFFTIYGVDETIIKLKNADDRIIDYKAVNVITVSPYLEFENLFTLLRNEMEKQYGDYKFVPFGLFASYIAELQIPYNYAGNFTVYDALFNSSLNGDYSTHVRGNLSYGYNEHPIQP